MKSISMSRPPRICLTCRRMRVYTCFTTITPLMVAVIMHRHKHTGHITPGEARRAKAHTMEDATDLLDLSKCKEMGRSCTCFNLRRAARAVTRLYDDFLRPSGLRTTQCSSLIAAKLRGPVTLTKLAEMTVTERTTLTRNLSVLQKKGLIRIEPGADRRERQVSITREGEEALAAVIPLWEAAQAHVEKELGGDRMSGLIKHLSEVISLSRKA